MLWHGQNATGKNARLWSEYPHTVDTPTTITYVMVVTKMAEGLSLRVLKLHFHNK